MIFPQWNGIVKSEIAFLNCDIAVACHFQGKCTYLLILMICVIIVRLFEMQKAMAVGLNQASIAIQPNSAVDGNNQAQAKTISYILLDNFFFFKYNILPLFCCFWLFSYN